VATCGECGFVYDELPVDEIAASLRGLAPSFRAALDGVDPAVVATRVEPGVWSALEYACHVRDVLLVQRERVVLAQVTERPNLAPMSRDERVPICRYDAQSAAAVVDQLAMAAELLALVFEGLTPAGLDRELLYNFPAPEVRDVAWVGRHTMHEGVHHLGDVRRVLARAESA
jgi:hypothetical protein